MNKNTGLTTMLTGKILKDPDLTTDYSLFVYAIKSPVTREYYLRRLRRFFDFLGLKEECTLEERCNYFAKLGKNDPSWAFSNIL